MWCGLSVSPLSKSLYNLGSTTEPSIETVRDTTTCIIIGGVNAGPVVVLVVLNNIQEPDVIVERNWMDFSSVSYYKEIVNLL